MDGLGGFEAFRWRCGANKHQASAKWSLLVAVRRTGRRFLGIGISTAAFFIAKFSGGGMDVAS